MALARLRLIEPTPVRSTVLHSLIEPTCCFSCFILISRRSRRPEHVYRDAGISYFSLWRCQMHATWDVRFSFSSTFVWSSVNLRACEHLLLQVLPQAHLTQFQTSVLTSSSIPSINVHEATFRTSITLDPVIIHPSQLHCQDSINAIWLAANTHNSLKIHQID